MTFNAIARPHGARMNSELAAPWPFHQAARSTAPAGPRRQGAPRNLEMLAQDYAARLREAGYSVAQGVAAMGRVGNATSPQYGAPSNVQSEIQALEAMAQSVFGTDCADWLRQPNPLLGGHTPASLMLAPCGRLKVRQLLKAYELAA